MVQRIQPRRVIGVPNSGPYVKRYQILELLNKCSILEPSLATDTPGINYSVNFLRSPSSIVQYNEFTIYSQTQ